MLARCSRTPRTLALSLAVAVERLAPRAVHATPISARYASFFFAFSYYFATDKRAVSVSPPEISRVDRRMSEIRRFSLDDCIN